MEFRCCRVDFLRPHQSHSQVTIMGSNRFSDLVVFKPWIGKDYGKRSIWGGPLLLIGESHYDWKDRTTPYCGVTRFCVRRTIAGEKGSKFYGNVLKLFRSALEPLSNKDFGNKDFWDSVAFYNYVQSMLPGIRSPLPSGMWEMSEEPFLEVIEKLRPSRMLVMGSEVWNHIRGIEEQYLRIDGRQGSKFLSVLKTPRSPRILTTWITHPSRGRRDESICAIQALLRGRA